MIEHYDINPDGDVLLTCFQAIEKSSTLTDCNDTTVLLQDENSQDILAEDLVVRQTSSFYDTSIEGYRELEGIDSRQEENLKDDSAMRISMRVSSQHIMLASSVFKAMLSREFKEGVTLQKQGLLELPLPDDDPKALLILLNIIHGHVWDVSRQINLQMLTKIAILVDKYEFHESIALFSEIWIEKLEATLPTSFTNDAIQWLCISCVFGRTLEFKKMTYFAIWQSVCNVSGLTGQYPIRESVIVAINERREKSLLSIISSLQSCLGRYHSSEIQCQQRDLNCDAMILGALTKALKRYNLEPPYRGTSLVSLTEAILEMSVPSLCTIKDGIRRKYDRQYDKYYDNYNHSFRQSDAKCSHVKDPLECIIRSLQKNCCGLDLWDFRAKSNEIKSSQRSTASFRSTYRP